MSDTSVRVSAAILSLKRFTVAELCEYTGLRRAQVDPVIGELKKEGFLEQVEIDAPAKPRHRPTGVYQIIGDRAKLQTLIDRVYRLRRAMGAEERTDTTDISTIQARLHGLDLSLDASLSATERRPLDRNLLERVEDELRSIHGLLESATYRRALDVRRQEHREHPVVIAWNSWQACQTRLHHIIDRWEQPAADNRYARIISPRVSSVKTLDIICDPRFIDSALFLWMFYEQPFRKADVDMDCRPVLSHWAEIPSRVAASKHAIGFFNNRRDGAEPTSNVGYWGDLCIYKGYALLAHPSFKLEKPPATLTESGYILRRLTEALRDGGHRPTVISIGHDTVYKFKGYLAPDVSSTDFHWKQVSDANEALRMFLKERNTFFVGGLPQRLHAQWEYEAIPVLEAKYSPTLYSVNGIVFNPGLDVGGKAVLQDVSSVWFDTVKQMKNRAFRHHVAAQVRDMLGQLGVDQSIPFSNDMFDAIFEGELELFATSPADATELYLAAQQEELLSRRPGPAVKAYDPSTEPQPFIGQLPATPMIPVPRVTGKEHIH